MNKLFTKIATFSVGLALAVGVGVAASSSKAGEAKAEATSVSLVAGNNTVAIKVNYNSSGEPSSNNGVRIGTSKNDGSASFVVPSGTTSFGFSVVGWKGTKNNSLNLSASAGTLSASSISLSNNDAATGTINADTVVAVTDTDANVKKTITISGVTEESTITLSSGSSNDKRSLIWDAWYETGGTPVTSYSVTDNVEHGSVSPSSVNEGATLTATITPDNGYKVPESVSVTMGGQAVTPTYSNGVVTVANVTGAIVISASCPEKVAPQPTELPDGEYTATLPYANPFPTSIDVSDGQSTVAALSASVSAVQTYDDSHQEYVFSKDAYFEIENLTNAVIKRIVVNVYQYRNFNVYVDDNVEPVYTGDGNKGDGNPVAIEVATNAENKIKILSNGGSGSYTLKLFSVELYLQVGGDAVPVTGVAVEPASGTTVVGGTQQINAVVTPVNADDKTVSYSSSDQNVATVSASGLVTAHAKGTAVITVTTNDGGFTATYTLTVVEVNYGTKDSPLSVEEARAVLDYTGSATSAQKLWVKGTVSTSSYNSNYQDYTVWLSSSDGETAQYFEIYSGSISEKITDDDTVENALAGKVVLCNGYGKIHNNSIYELFKVNTEKPTIEKYTEIVPVTEYDVTYQEGQASHGTKVAEGTEITIDQPTQAAPEGKAFDCWVANDQEYQPGDPYVVNANVTFVAQYVDVVVKYTVTYQEGSNSYSSKFDDGTKITIASPKDEAPEHYEFTCWRVNSTDYQPGAEYTVTGNVTFVAIYSKVPPVLESIEVTTLPTKVEYYPNEEFESAGIVVTATYDYGDPKDVTSEVEYSGFDSSKLGEVTVTVTYLTKSTTFTVTIVKAPITDWEPEQKEAFMDVVGKELPFINADFVENLEKVEDSSGAYFRADVLGDYLNDVLAALNSWDYTYYDADQECYFVTDPCGEGRAVVQVGEMYGYTILFYSADPYNGIVVVDGDFDYYVGDSLDISSLEMYVTNKSMSAGGYLPGSDCDFSVTEFETAGVIEVTVTYGYYYGTFEVEVTPVLPVSLELDVSGAKTTYKVDDEFEPAGLVARLVNNNGSKVDVSSDVTISGFDTSSVGEREVTVSYGNFSASYIITVVPKYDADAFAAQFLSEISRVCSGYDGKSSNKEALKSVWATMKQNYNSLTPEEKMRVIKAEAKTGGSELEQVMAFYDYACRKYGLEKFVENRSIKAMVFEEQTPNNNLPIIFIVASSIAAVTLIGVVIAYARRRRLYVK